MLYLFESSNRKCYYGAEPKVWYLENTIPKIFFCIAGNHITTWHQILRAFYSIDCRRPVKILSLSWRYVGAGATQSPLTDNERRMITSTFPVLSKARSNENSSHYASELPRHLGLVRQQLVGCCPTGFAEMMASLHLIKVWSYSVVYTSLSLWTPAYWRCVGSGQEWSC